MIEYLIGDKVFSASGLKLDNLTVSELNITLRGAFQGTVSAAVSRTKGYKSTIQHFWAFQVCKITMCYKILSTKNLEWRNSVR